MANQSFAQGLLQNLLAPQQQRMSPQDIMAAMSSPNPMAAVMAASVPQTTQAIGQGIRGMLGGITGQTPYSATEAYNKAMQQISQQPSFGTTSDSLTAMAQAANAVGRIPEAIQFMAQANELKLQEDKKIQQSDTLINFIDSSIANAKSEDAKAAMQDIKLLVGQLPASDIISQLNDIRDSFKEEAPKTYEFQAEWAAWETAQAPGADTSYPSFVTWKTNTTRSQSEYQAWKKENPEGTMEDYWQTKAEAQRQETAPQPRPISTPTQGEKEAASSWVTRNTTAIKSWWFDQDLMSSEDREVFANELANETARVKAEKGGTFQDNIEEAAQRLRSSGRISVDEEGNVSVTAPSSQALTPAPSVESFYNNTSSPVSEN